MNARAYKSLETQTRPNTLPDIVFTEWDTPIIGAPEKNSSVRTAGKISPEAKVKRKRAVLYISMISVVFLMLSGIVYRYSMISEMGKETRELESKIEEYGTLIDSMNMSILEKSDLREVQNKAILLNMGFAENSQIRYIELAKDNTHSITEQKTEKGFFEKLFNGEL